MELTPLSPAPWPVQLFGLGSVVAGLTTLALATPSPHHGVRRLARPCPARVMYAVPPSGPADRVLCQAQSPPNWLHCQGYRCIIDRRGWQQAQAMRWPRPNAPERIAPALRSGRPVGMQLTAVPPCSRAYWLGLRSGDLLTRVNGLDLSTRERMVGAYSQLRTASHFTLDIERAGRTVTYDYVVR